MKRESSGRSLRCLPSSSATNTMTLSRSATPLAGFRKLALIYFSANAVLTAGGPHASANAQSTTTKARHGQQDDPQEPSLSQTRSKRRLRGALSSEQTNYTPSVSDDFDQGVNVDANSSWSNQDDQPFDQDGEAGMDEFADFAGPGISLEEVVQKVQHAKHSYGSLPAAPRPGNGASSENEGDLLIPGDEEYQDFIGDAAVDWLELVSETFDRHQGTTPERALRERGDESVDPTLTKKDRNNHNEVKGRSMNHEVVFGVADEDTVTSSNEDATGESSPSSSVGHSLLGGGIALPVDSLSDSSIPDRDDYVRLIEKKDRNEPRPRLKNWPNPTIDNGYTPTQDNGAQNEDPEPATGFSGVSFPLNKDATGWLASSSSDDTPDDRPTRPWRDRVNGIIDGGDENDGETSSTNCRRLRHLRRKRRKLKSSSSKSKSKKSSKSKSSSKSRSSKSNSSRSSRSSSKSSSTRDARGLGWGGFVRPSSDEIESSSDESSSSPTMHWGGFKSYSSDEEDRGWWQGKMDNLNDGGDKLEEMLPLETRAPSAPVRGWKRKFDDCVDDD